jgi:hypothetical protein
MSVPTAEEFIARVIKFESQNDTLECTVYSLSQLMIEFARLHTEAALHIASERADLTDNGSFPYVDKVSILKSYPLNKIK